MKIAIYYDNRFGRNDGPPAFYTFQLERLFGKESIRHIIPGEPDMEKDGPFDLHFWVDWGEDAVLGAEQALKLVIPDDGGKKIYVVSDAHLDSGYRFEKAQQFDYIFFNQKHYISQFLNGEYDLHNGELIKDGDGLAQVVGYLPHAAEPLVYNRAGKQIIGTGKDEKKEFKKVQDMEVVKKYNLCFIGHIQEYHKDNGINMSRIDVLDAMFKNFPNFYFGSRNPAFPDKNMFEDAAHHFAESKVVFNISIGNDLNMRFFETLSTGSFLLTNLIPELKNAELYGFKDGVHYVSYTDLDDAVTKAQYYIDNDEEREKIAEAGYKQALKTGTYESRIREICKKLKIEIPIKA